MSLADNFLLTTFRIRRMGTTSTGGESSSEDGQMDVVGAGQMDEGMEVESGSMEAAVSSGVFSSLLLI